MRLNINNMASKVLSDITEVVKSEKAKQSKLLKTSHATHASGSSKKALKKPENMLADGRLKAKCNTEISIIS